MPAAYLTYSMAMAQRAIAALVLVISVVVVLEAAKIKVQKDPKIDVATFKTWIWHPTAPGDVKVWISADSKSEPVKKQYEPILMQAVEEQIAARGYTPASAPPADFVLTYRLLIAMNDSSQYMGQFLPTNANWGIPPFSPQTQSFSYYPQGTLIIDAEMPNSGPIIWRGIAEAKVELENSDEKRTARLRAVIKELMGKFPKKAVKKG